MTRMELDQFVAEHGMQNTSPLPFDLAVQEAIRRSERHGRVKTKGFEHSQGQTSTQEYELGNIDISDEANSYIDAVDICRNNIMKRSEYHARI